MERGKTDAARWVVRTGCSAAQAEQMILISIIYAHTTHSPNGAYYSLTSPTVHTLKHRANSFSFTTTLAVRASLPHSIYEAQR